MICRINMKRKSNFRVFSLNPLKRKGYKAMEEKDKQSKINEDAALENPEAVVVDDVNSTVSADNEASEEVAEGADTLLAENESLKESLAKEKKEYLFLMAEFDNFRKRTLREKSEIIRNAGEQVWKSILPIVDDFERGLKAAENTKDAESIKEGMTLVYNKLKKVMEQNGVKEMDPDDHEFDADRHEAISAVPVADESQKGKILDTVEKGYTINDKVLRHAKVVVGQ